MYVFLLDKSEKQSGNVLFLILIAVVLFSALSYVVVSSRSGAISIEDEQQGLDQAVLNNCETAINTALMRLKFTFGCDNSEINYELPDGTNENPNAPTDDHCNVFHPAYGGASPCGNYANCDLTLLQNIGDRCDGVVYAGDSLGYRLYTSTADHSTGVMWNNGATNYTVTGATSGTDGAANTDTLVGLSDAGAPYQPAQLCRAQGSEWYLPAIQELHLFYTNRVAIGGFDTSPLPSTSGFYWSSTEYNDERAWAVLFGGGSQGQGEKGILSFRVRCARQD